MLKKIPLLFLSLLSLIAASGQSDSTTYKKIRPKNKSFSTYIIVDGLIQNLHIGLENNQYYLLNNFFGNTPVANLKYICNEKHHFGLKFGIDNNAQSYTRTDSLFFNSTITTSKMSRTIKINPLYDGYFEDKNSTNEKAILFTPFYEYHFQGTRRWDYFIGAEYLLNMSISPKSKNFEDLVYTNYNGDKIEYTFKSKKSIYVRNHGLIATFGVNYFIFHWLSIGTKISLSKQFSYYYNDSFEEKLLVNGVDKTSDLNISTLKYKNYKTSNLAFLNASTGGFISTYFLPLIVNFYF